MKRFKVVHIDDLTPSQRDEAVVPDGTCAWCVVDNKTGRVVGSDYADPEDKILVRDFDWVPNELNKMDTKVELALDAIAHMRMRCIKKEEDRALWVFVDDIERILKDEP